MRTLDSNQLTNRNYSNKSKTWNSKRRYK